MEKAAIIAALGLRPHPTCGYVAETFRSADIVPGAALPPRFGGPRPLGQVLTFLVAPEARILLHRIRSDQMYHFYEGDPLEVLLLYPDGNGEVVTLGGDVARGGRLQLLIPGDTFTCRAPSARAASRSPRRPSGRRSSPKTSRPATRRRSPRAIRRWRRRSPIFPGRHERRLRPRSVRQRLVVLRRSVRSRRRRRWSVLQPERRRPLCGRPRAPFAFGTLRDPDLFAVVAGRPLRDFRLGRARLPGFRAVLARGYPFPVAVADAGAALPGLLVEGLDWESLARLAFYESGGYRLAPVTVLAGGRTVVAAAFLTDASLTPGDVPWRLARWRRAAKRHAVAAAALAMAHYGRLSVDELDRLWAEIERTAAERLAAGAAGEPPPETPSLAPFGA